MTVLLHVVLRVDPVDEHDEEVESPTPTLHEDIKASAAEAVRDALHRGYMNGFNHAMGDRVSLRVERVEAAHLFVD